MKLYMLTALLLTFAFSCKQTTEPPPPPTAKDPRTYTWTVDTITYPGSFQTIMRSIWASGPENVYIVGHNDNPGTPTMFRFDGIQWRTTEFHASAGGTISNAVSLSKVYGFGAADVWVAGERIYQVGNTFPDSSFLMHFDGSRWSEATIVGGRGRMLQSLWGASPTDIWAGGINTLLHYNGARWSHFPIQMPGEGIQFLSIAGLSASEVYMIGSRRDATGNNDTAAYMLYQFNGFSWTLIDSSIQVLGRPLPKFGVILNSVAGTLYSVMDGIFRRSNQEWERIYLGPSTIVGIAGTSSTRIFAVGTRTQIVHYDGRDAYRFPQFPDSNIDFYSVWANQEQVFALAHNGHTTFVARGK